MDTPTLSFSESAQYLCQEATKNEGLTLATRVLVEALTPGLRHFNAFFKESLRLARNVRAPELEATLKEHQEFEKLLGTICKDLQSASQQEWWNRVVEVAECGAQRDVLTRLVYKQIVGSPEAQELRSSWQEVHLQTGGAQQFIKTLGKTATEAEVLVIEQLAQAGLSLREVPKLPTESQVEWMLTQKKLIEAMMSQNWSEVREHLRSLVKLSPRDPAVCLYWSLSKCSEGKVNEAINGVKRAAEVAPNNTSLQTLLKESELWKESLAEEKRQQEERLLESNDSDVTPETRLGQPTGYASKKNGQVSNLSSRSQANKPNLHQNSWTNEDWKLPTGLIQAIADLGPQRTLDVSVTGLMSQLYYLSVEQRAHLNNALKKYPEAQALVTMEKQLKRTLNLIERGLGVYQLDPHGGLPPLTLGVSHTGMATLSPAQLAELRNLQPLINKANEVGDGIEMPPPIPFSQGSGDSAPTAMVNLVTPMPSQTLSPASESLSLDIEAPLDFTLEPEATDLAQAEALMRRGEFAQAEHCLLALLDQNPFDACVHNDLGVLYFKTQRFGDAKAHFMLAIECAPHYEEAWSNLVELFASLGHLHHALPFFRRFEALIEASVSLKRLHELCAQFAPEGVDELQPPEYQDTTGLRLP